MTQHLSSPTATVAEYARQHGLNPADIADVIRGDRHALIVPVEEGSDRFLIDDLDLVAEHIAELATDDADD